jgi:hypothetical protein
MSVSREQAILSCQGDRFYLVDTGSKFGTFVKSEGMILVDQQFFGSREDSMPIMIQDNLIYFWVEPRLSIFQRCFQCLIKEPEFLTYEESKQFFP